MKRIAYALVGDEILGTIASATEALAVGWRAQWFGTPCPPDAAVTVSCQSCLSRLGKNLGVALLTRHRGPLKLTETANRLLPHVRQICTSVNAIRTEISAVSGLETGSLRLASVPSLASAILPPLMSDGREAEKYPLTAAVSDQNGEEPDRAGWTDRLCYAFGALG